MIVSVFIATATDKLARLCLGILFFHRLVVAEESQLPKKLLLVGFVVGANLGINIHAHHFDGI